MSLSEQMNTPEKLKAWYEANPDLRDIVRTVFDSDAEDISGADIIRIDAYIDSEIEKHPEYQERGLRVAVFVDTMYCIMRCWERDKKRITELVDAYIEDIRSGKVKV